MNALETIKSSINHLNSDLRAEIVVNALLENGMSEHDFLVQYTGVFKRAYRKDIVGASLTDINKFDECLLLELSRDGLYDLLPEGLFHTSHKGSNQSVGKMVAEHKRFKQEENEARKFFAPFEHEFFLQKRNVEFHENLFLQRATFEKNTMLSKLWRLNKDLPQFAAKKLLELLPETSQICGRIPLMESSLEKVLNEKVKVSLHYHNQRFLMNENLPLQECALGENSVTGQYYEECIPEYTFHIGPLEHLRIEDFLPEASYQKVLQTFFEYFVPLEAEIKTNYLTSKSTLQPIDKSILGYNFELE